MGKNSFSYIKTYNFCISKDTLNEIKQRTLGEKIYNVSNKEKYPEYIKNFYRSVRMLTKPLEKLI